MANLTEILGKPEDPQLWRQLLQLVGGGLLGAGGQGPAAISVAQTQAKSQQERAASQQAARVATALSQMEAAGDFKGALNTAEQAAQHFSGFPETAKTLKERAAKYAERVQTRAQVDAMAETLRGSYGPEGMPENVKRILNVVEKNPEAAKSMLEKLMGQSPQTLNVPGRGTAMLDPVTQSVGGILPGSQPAPDVDISSGQPVSIDRSRPGLPVVTKIGDPLPAQPTGEVAKIMQANPGMSVAEAAQRVVKVDAFKRDLATAGLDGELAPWVDKRADVISVAADLRSDDAMRQANARKILDAAIQERESYRRRVAAATEAEKRNAGIGFITEKNVLIFDTATRRRLNPFTVSQNDIANSGGRLWMIQGKDVDDFQNSERALLDLGITKSLVAELIKADPGMEVFSQGARIWWEAKTGKPAAAAFEGFQSLQKVAIAAAVNQGRPTDKDAEAVGALLVNKFDSAASAQLKMAIYERMMNTVIDAMSGSSSSAQVQAEIDLAIQQAAAMIRRSPELNKDIIIIERGK